MTLLYFVAAWAAGIFLASSAHTPVGAWLAVATAGFALAYGLRRRRWFRLGLICAALCALGAARYGWAARPLPSDHIAHYADTGYATLTGVVVRSPDVREDHQNLYVASETIWQEGAPRRVQGLALVQAPRYGDFAYGDRIRVSGQVLTPPEFDDFSYQDYLARRGVHVMIPNAETEVIARDQGRPWLAALAALRDRAGRTIDRLLPSPQAPLLQGILLGQETAISEPVREAFNQTGTAHVIAISGANLVIVIRALMGLLKPALGLRRASLFTMFGIGLYTVLVGAEAAVVRAAIMGGMALLAAQLGRKSYGLTSLAFAVWLMSFWNPLMLWEVGFQLSVAATAGLVLFGDDLSAGLERLLRRVFAQDTARQVTRVLAEPLVVSIAAQITTTPLVLIYFGRLSLIALIANLLIVPAQVYIMILGWLAVLAGLVVPILGQLLAWAVWIPLTYTLDIVRGLGKFEWASVQVNLPASYAWSVYGVLLVAGLVSLQHSEDRAAMFRYVRRHVTALAIVVVSAGIAALVWTDALSQPDGRLHVRFLDVGNGNAILIQTPSGAQILVDGGPNPSRLRQAVGDALPFRDRDLDILIVTQDTNAAIGALPALVEQYDIGLTLTSPSPDGSDSFKALVGACEQHDIPMLSVSSGHRIETGDGVTMELFNTPGGNLVLRVRFGDSSFLITPDLDEDDEQVARDAGWFYGSTVFVLPSQGSASANPEWLLQAVRPQVAVVMVGTGNRSERPAPETIERLKSVTRQPLYRTDHHGTIEIVTDGETLDIYTGR